MNTSNVKSNFHPKKSNKRKMVSNTNMQMNAQEYALEFGFDYVDAYFYLGQKRYQFDPNKGAWSFVEASTSNNQKIPDSTPFENIDLINENNLLKVKHELLLDMLAESFAERDKGLDGHS